LAYKRDFVDLQYKIVNRHLNVNQVQPWVFDKYGYIINGRFPYINIEKYKAKVTYVLPKKTTGNSQVIEYKNRF